MDFPSDIFKLLNSYPTSFTDVMAKGLAFYSYYCTKKDLLNDLIVFMNDENKYTKKQKAEGN